MPAAKRILFVDDEPNVLQGLQRMLRAMREEWEMHFAEGGAKGLELMTQVAFDVVVSDMRMPGMNGAQFLKEVMRLYPSTVRLVLSGHADQELVAQCVGVAHQYLSKPCDPEQLKTMVRNACLMSSELVNEEVRRIIGAIDQLPSVPALYRELQESLKDEDISTQVLGDIIARDMGMTAKILKLVNSAFFGLRRSISTAQEAVSYLGIETIKVLVLGNGIFEQAKAFRTRVFGVEDLWHHTLAVASGAKSIAHAERAGKALEDEAFAGGTLHDLGILVLASNFPEDYDRVAATAIYEQLPIPEIERELFGVTHAEVGAYLLGLWGIPTPILKVVSLHHRPAFLQEPGYTTVLAVHGADSLLPKGSRHLFFESGIPDESAFRAAGMADRIQIWQKVLGEAPEA